jgi:hypothetical protein
VFICWDWYQRNHQQKDSPTTEDSRKDKRISKDHCETEELEVLPNTNVITVTYIDERQLESNVHSKVFKVNK